MKHTIVLVSLVLALVAVTSAQTPAAGPGAAIEQEIIALEKQWNAAIQRRDVAAMDNFLADTYFLGVAVQGKPLQIFPRAQWLEMLNNYKVQEFNIDEIRVGVYGDTAVVLMLYTQKATVGREQADRSAQFVITDVWVKQRGGWRVAERHSSRPEPAAGGLPK